MRGILDPNVRTEVDYNKATKDMSVVLVLWRTGNTSGKKTFIATIEYPNTVRNALWIIRCAVEDRKVIIKDYMELFRYDSINVYNDLISNISENMKQLVPFVNMFLRVWRTKLVEDGNGNFWADLYLLDFDKWLPDEI